MKSRKNKKTVSYKIGKVIGKEIYKIGKALLKPRKGMFGKWKQHLKKI